MGVLEFWSLGFFDTCSFLAVLCDVCLLCFAFGIHLQFLMFS